MASVNKVIIIGHLGADPELKFTQGGEHPYCTLSVACNRVWRDDAGEKQEEVEWVRVVLWRRQAEVAAEYLTKGAPVYVEGRLQTRSWEEDGQKRYMTEVVAQQMQMLGKRGETYGGRSDGPPREAPPDRTGVDAGDLPFE